MEQGGHGAEVLSEYEANVSGYLDAANAIQGQLAQNKRLTVLVNAGELETPELINLATGHLRAQQAEAFGRLLLSGAGLPLENVVERREVADTLIDRLDGELTSLDRGESAEVTKKHREAELLTEIIPELQQEIVRSLAEVIEREAASRRGRLEAERERAIELRDYLAGLLVWPIPELLPPEEREAMAARVQRGEGITSEVLAKEGQVGEGAAPEAPTQDVPAAEAQDVLGIGALERLRAEVAEKEYIAEKLATIFINHPGQQLAYSLLAEVVYGSSDAYTVQKVSANIRHLAIRRPGVAKRVFGNSRLRLDMGRGAVTAVPESDGSSNTEAAE